MAIREYLQRVFPGRAEEFFQQADEALLSGKKLFVITANPEIMIHAENTEALSAMLKDPAHAVIPDGISVVKAMQSIGIPAKERITGVDLAARLLDTAGKNGKSVFLLGAREEVVSTLAENLRKQYPGITVRCRNGYEGDKDEIFREEIAPAAPDLVLVALGVPAQEGLISRNLHLFEKGVFVGVGGSFDVLSGSKRRAPAFFVKTNTEWLYRIVREPSRLKRFYNNNVKFLRLVKKESRVKEKP